MLRTFWLSFIYLNSHHNHHASTQMLHFRKAFLIPLFKTEHRLPLFSSVLSVNFPVFLPCVYGPSTSHRISIRIHYNKDLSIVHAVAFPAVHSDCYSVKNKQKSEKKNYQNCQGWKMIWVFRFKIFKCIKNNHQASKDKFMEGCKIQRQAVHRLFSCHHRSPRTVELRKWMAVILTFIASLIFFRMECY